MGDAARFRIGPWTITPALNLLECEARSIKIEPRAMDVLVHLARQDGAVVSVDALIAAVWQGLAVGDGSVYLAISQLRQALGDAGDGMRYIETIPKRGYRLVVPVEREAVVVAGLEADPHEPRSRFRPHRLWRWRGAAAATLAGVVAVAFYAAATTERHMARTRVVVPQSVAVLPFDNLSSDPEQAYFADGLTIELLQALSRVRHLRVTGRTSSFQVRDRRDDLPAIAETLGVDHVLQGSVRKAGGRVRITVQLSRARTGEALWAETYERQLDDIFLIQEAIARSVADALQVTLGVGDVGRAPGMTRNVAAYDEYLHGMARNLDWRPESLPVAIVHLQRAVALDPSFSMAWVGLSAVYSNGVFVAPDRAEEWRQKATEAFDRARALTPDAPHVWLEAGVTDARRANWLGAARAFDRLEQACARYGLPNQASGPRGVLLLAVGRVREAIPALERARAEEPLAPAFAGFLASALLADGNLTGAFAEIDRGLTLEGLDGPLRKAGLVAALTHHDRAEIEKRLGALPDTAPDARVNRRLVQLLDAPAEAPSEIRRLASSANRFEKTMLVQWAAFYHQPELSRQLLTDVASQLSHPAVLWQPLLRDVRRLPAFKDLVRSLGLVDYWRVYGWSDFCRPTSGEDFACE